LPVFSLRSNNKNSLGFLFIFTNFPVEFARILIHFPTFAAPKSSFRIIPFVMAGINLGVNPIVFGKTFEPIKFIKNG